MNSLYSTPHFIKIVYSTFQGQADPVILAGRVLTKLRMILKDIQAQNIDFTMHDATCKFLTELIATNLVLL